MKSRSSHLLLVLLGLMLLLMPGCTDQLGQMDLSGTIDLNPAMSGWAYRKIASASLSRDINPQARLYDYQSALNLHQTAALGPRQYLFIGRFADRQFQFTNNSAPITLNTLKWRTPRDFQTVVYDLQERRQVETLIEQDREYGDSWYNPIDNGKDALQTYRSSRTGEFILSFFEPGTGFDCIVQSKYTVSATATRRKNKDGFFVQDSKTGLYIYDTLSISGSSELWIGFRQVLSGEKLILDKSVAFHVIDWNLDGEFSEADRLWSDHLGKALEFGKTIRLTGSLPASKDNKYILRLIKPGTPGGTYRLSIELVATGKK